MAKPPPLEPPADIDRVGELLVEASKLSNHKEFVIIGSLSVLASEVPAPDEMLMSIDVDFYPLLDPGRAGEIAGQLGPESEFAETKGLYADAVSPFLAFFPTAGKNACIGWRILRVSSDFYLDPNDCAVAKLARNERRDQHWVRQGIRAGIINPEVVEHRMATVPFLDARERDRAAASLEIQTAWARTFK